MPNKVETCYSNFFVNFSQTKHPRCARCRVLLACFWDWKVSWEFFPFWSVHNNAHGDLCDCSISVSDDRLMLTTNNAHACGPWVSCDPWLLGCSVLFSCCEKVRDLVFPCGETAPHGPRAAAGGSARQTVTTPVAHSKRCDDAVAHDLVMLAFAFFGLMSCLWKGPR